jgi:MFS family permease
VGQVLVILGLASLTYAIIEGPIDGWGSATIIALFAVSLATFALLVPYELRRHEPLIDVRFFRSRPFSGAAISAVCAFGGYGAFLFLNTLYLQDARGLSALDAGLYTLPLAVSNIVFAPFTGRLVARIGTRRPLLLAGVALGVAPLLLTALTPSSPVWLLLLSYVIFGAGLGLANPPITNTAISGMPPEQAGVAGAIASSSRQVGATIGIALVGAIVGTGSGLGIGPAFAHATHPGWWFIAGLAAILFVVGALTTTPRAFASAHDVAADLQPERIPG